MTAGGYSFSRPNGKTKSKQAQKRQKLTAKIRLEKIRKKAHLKTFDDTSFSINALLILIARIARQSIVNLIVILRFDFLGKSHFFWGHFWPTRVEDSR